MSFHGDQISGDGGLLERAFGDCQWCIPKRIRSAPPNAQHLDHIHRHADGGSTIDMNGRGVCERGNYVCELPGWTVRLLDPDDHTVITITPTGHRYVSNPPEPP